MALSKEESCQEKCDVNSHISLPQDLIDKLKNVKNWEEWPCRWTFDEERMSMAWLWSHCMYDDNIHQLHRAGDDVVIAETRDELSSEGMNPEVPSEQRRENSFQR